MLDFIGIGLGPFNLSLASLIHQKTDLKYVFFEQKEQFDWHAGMQLPNTVLQVPFMADLVSMVDPTSPFSFLNYLRHHQRLYKFYFLEQPHIPRREYNHYCQWVAQQLDDIQYQTRVLEIEPQQSGFRVLVDHQGIQKSFLCRNLIIGSGNIPALPNCLKEIQKQLPEQCVHSAEYMTRTQRNLSGDVVVLGSGQSAAEVFIDLFDHQKTKEKHQFNLHWFTRSQGFFPMEYTPLGLEYFSPDYIKHFYELPEHLKEQQLQQQALLYKGISAKTLRDIYEKMYHRTVANSGMQTYLHSQCELKQAEVLNHQKIRLYFQHLDTAESFYLDCDAVIAATGYSTPKFDFMKQLEPYIKLDQQKRWKISKDYRLIHQLNGKIFVQNQEMHSHGVGTPDLGLGAHRAATIINQLLDQPLYQLNDIQQTFQNFDLEQNPKIILMEKNRSIEDQVFEQNTVQKKLNLKTNDSIEATKAASNTVKKVVPTQPTSVHSTYEKLV